MNKFKILDCTLRDGGYYTNWDFDPILIDAYLNAINKLPIQYIEIGYRSNPVKEYMGKLGYTPISVLKQIRKKCTKKIAVMLNEKNTNPEDLNYLIAPLRGLVDMIRIAVDPINFERAVLLAKSIKDYGFEIGFNTMYMSKWNDYEGFLLNLYKINGIANLFCMVDSFGGISPNEVENIFKIVKQNTTCPIGFHGHNNLQLSLINTIKAIECGVDFVDVTVLGMGRGAGNLNMELLLTYLNKEGLEVDFNVLGDVISAFQPLWEKYKWGTNLPYMLSGANSFPQKEVMDWVTNRTYSFNSIVRALNNKRNNVKDNARYPNIEVINTSKVLILGGGNSVVIHKEAINEFILNNPDMSLIFATARHAALYNNIANKKYYCLVGNEAKRLSYEIKADDFNGKCILAPYPRMMGTEVPSFAESSTQELTQVTFTKDYIDSCTSVALQIAIELKANEIYVVGYDGYQGQILSEKEMDLTRENRTLFSSFNQCQNKPLISLTPTLYKELEVRSVYQFL